MLHNAKIVGFVEGTHVLMADGKWKTIESIKEGDMVMSFETDRDDGELHPRKVTNTWNGIVRDCVEVHQSGKVTIVAKDQMFFTPGALWSHSFDTKQVLDYSGAPIAVQTRKVRGGKHKLYDITVDETHAFIANDMRVHNGGGGGSKKKQPAPQPVVTAGKPGQPVSVTTTTRNGTTTVVVNPSPGSSGQISVGAGGSITARQNRVPGVGLDYVTYEVPRMLPYPVYYQYSDRVSNAQLIRDGVCGDILSRGPNYRVTKNDARDWNAQFDALLGALNDIKKDRGIRYKPMGRGNDHHIYQDPSTINDAITEITNLKNDLKAGKKLNFGQATSRCAKVEGILNRIDGQVGNGRVRDYNPRVPLPHCECPELPVCPAPENYFSDRIYEDNANYGYYTKVGCTYLFDPPNAPAVTSVKYYKHWDSVTNKYYYDRVGSQSICTTTINEI